MAVIYCYTNLINGKKYIGQTINEKLRFNVHKSAFKKECNLEYNSPLHKAMRKYGYENFNYTILQDELPNNPEVLKKLENYYIELYNTKVPNGYNINSGMVNLNHAKQVSNKIKNDRTWDQAKLTEQEVIELRKAYQNGESPSQIYQNKYKNILHYNSFLNIWSGKRYKNIMPEVFKNKSHTKLNNEIVKKIREDRNKNQLSYQELSKKYNISKPTIADIIKKRTWINV